MCYAAFITKRIVVWFARLVPCSTRSFAALTARIGSMITPRRTRWPVLGVVAEAEAPGQHTALHTRIARSILNVLAGSVEFVRTTPTTH